MGDRYPICQASIGFIIRVDGKTIALKTIPYGFRSWQIRVQSMKVFDQVVFLEQGGQASNTHRVCIDATFHSFDGDAKGNGHY